MVSLIVPGISYVFVFLLIFAIVYGLLTYVDIFKRRDINAIIALSVGFLALLSSFFVTFISLYIPMVIAAVLVVFLAILLLATTLTPTKSITSYLVRSPLVALLMIFIMLLFAFNAFGTTYTIFAPHSNSTTSAAINPNVSPLLSGALSGTYIVDLLTSPNVLALLVSFLVMLFGVYFMTRLRGQ
ncbi:MAG: hypothetical protein OH316_02525 [Candidatus Parvarchaeota archaeon]|nr:hypothetical protein [Candidatus Parvarchaeota archaeon]